jgi:hypothetical protein
MTAPNRVDLYSEWRWIVSAITFVINATAMQSLGNQSANLPEVA